MTRCLFEKNAKKRAFGRIMIAVYYLSETGFQNRHSFDGRTLGQHFRTSVHSWSERRQFPDIGTYGF